MEKLAYLVQKETKEIKVINIINFFLLLTA